MASNWYVSSVAHASVAQFAINHAYVVGDLIRQLAAPSVDSERVFRCTTAGTTAGSEPSWNLTKAATTTSGTATFTEVTGDETYQGTSWAAPHARIKSAIGSGWAAAGDTIFVSADHAETTTATITWTAVGTLAAPTNIISVTRPSSAIPPALADIAAGASVTTTTTGTMTFNGNFHCYGVTFSCGSNSSAQLTFAICATTADRQCYDTCTFTGAQTSTGSFQLIAGAGASTTASCEWRNVTYKPSNASCIINASGCPIRWYGGSIAAGTAPTTLFTPASAGALAGAEVNSVDLSLLAASSTLVSVATTVTQSRYSFTNCKLATNLSAVTTGSIAGPETVEVDMVVSDSTANVKVREEHYRYAGSVVADTTNYLTAGSTDGTTHRSHKYVSAANCSPVIPLIGPEIFQWVSSTGSKTITLYIANTSSLTLTNAQFSIDVEYLGASSSPLGTMGTTFTQPGVTGASITADTQPWTGLVSPTRQRVVKTITVNQVGWIRVRPYLRRASTTMWVDPLVTVS